MDSDNEAMDTSGVPTDSSYENTDYETSEDEDQPMMNSDEEDEGAEIQNPHPICRFL